MVFVEVKVAKNWRVQYLQLGDNLKTEWQVMDSGDDVEKMSNTSL
jgi:hypothetical protein